MSFLEEVYSATPEVSLKKLWTMYEDRHKFSDGSIVAEAKDALNEAQFEFYKFFKSVESSSAQEIVKMSVDLLWSLNKAIHVVEGLRVSTEGFVEHE